MTALSLPATAVPNAVDPYLVDFGGVLTPFLGGPSQRINRLGMRMAGRFSLPPKLYGTQGRVIVTQLMRAKAGTLIMPWPQPGLTIGSEGTPKVKVAVSGGTSLQIKGLPASKALVHGQYLSIVKAATGIRCLHALTADATANGSGDVTVSVWPPMRTSFAVNDVIEIAAPKIEGHVQVDELGWSISVDKMTAIAFTLVEAK